jgi:hypothetical protein
MAKQNEDAANKLFYQGVQSYTNGQYGDAMTLMQQALKTGGPTYSKRMSALESMQTILRLIDAGKKWGLNANSTPVPTPSVAPDITSARADPMAAKNAEFKALMNRNNPGGGNAGFDITWKKRQIIP